MVHGAVFTQGFFEALGHAHAIAVLIRPDAIDGENTDVVSVMQPLLTAYRQAGNAAQHRVDEQISPLLLRDGQLCQKIVHSGAVFEFDIHLGDMASAP